VFISSRCQRLALFGRATTSELSLFLGVKRKLDFELAKGSFWRLADNPAGPPHVSSEG
jgi:hypothetical protein